MSKFKGFILCTWKDSLKMIKNIFKKVLTFNFHYDIIGKRFKRPSENGGLAQLARASGSYPAGRWFKSDIRYHNGSLVKRLRHRPFTAVTGVRFSHESPNKLKANPFPLGDGFAFIVYFNYPY